MTDANTLASLRELMEKASPRPWSARIGGEYADDVWVASKSQRPWEDHMALKLWSRTMGRGDYPIGSPEHKAAVANAKLLCAAVNALPGLLAVAEAAARVDAMRESGFGVYQYLRPDDKAAEALERVREALSKLGASND